MKEVWKKIPNFENMYMVSNKGRVKHVIKGDVKTYTENNGYERVNLGRETERRTVSVHRLVAIAFMPNPEGKKTVNHIDFTRNNNLLNNLEWCTHKENNQHAIDNKRRRTGKGKYKGCASNAKLNYSKAELIREIYFSEFNKPLKNKRLPFTQRWLAKCFKVHQATIYKVLSNKRWTHANI